MPQIKIGREGNQPFAINAQNVSREHATVEINEYGGWSITDHSTNGTFVRDEVTGELTRVTGTRQISKNTFIVLGSDDAHGCSFYAEALRGINAGYYNSAHGVMRDRIQDLETREENVTKRARYIRIAIWAVMGIITLLTFIPSFCDWAERALGMNSSNMFLGYRVIMFGSMGFNTLYDTQGKKQKIKKLRERFNQCPNPRCSHRMSDREINNHLCNSCKNS